MNRAKLVLMAITGLVIALLSVVPFPVLSVATEPTAPQWSLTYPRRVNYAVNGYPVEAWGDEGYTVVQTSDGGFAVLALLNDHHYEPHTGGVDNFTSVIIKTDTTGAMQWQKRTPLITAPRTMFQTQDSGYIVAGSNLIVKLNVDGEMEWSKNFSGIYPYAMVQASNGGDFWLAGFTQPFESGSVSVANLMRINVSGDLVWNRTYSSDTYGGVYCIAEAGDGRLAVAGQRDGAWFGIVDSDGNLVVSRSYAEFAGWFNAIAKTGDGRFVLAGGPPSHVAEQAFVAEVDSTGQLMWSHFYNNPPDDSFSFVSVAQTLDGGLVASGETALFRLDSAGNLQWYISRNNDVTNIIGTTRSVVATSDGGFAVAGTKSGSAWLAKFPAELDANPSPSSTSTSQTGLSDLATAAFVASVIINAILAVVVVILVRKRRA